MKLGRIKLRVVEIKREKSVEIMDNHNSKNYDKKQNCNNENDKNIHESIIYDHNNKPVNIENSFNEIPETKLKKLKKVKNTCRICYCDDQEVESPLIIPCNCTGTMRYIHFSCLQIWLKSKAVIKYKENDVCANYSLKEIECELCKSKLPGIR